MGENAHAALPTHMHNAEQKREIDCDSGRFEEIARRDV
jgi:hypothetical protein